MNKNLCFLSLCFLFIVFLMGCTQQTQAPTRIYSNGFYDFSFDPPTGWHQVATNNSSTAVQFSPDNSSNVSLYVAVPFTLSEGRSLSTFADQTEENLIASGAEFTILHRDWGLSARYPTYELAYSYEQNGTRNYVKQVAILRTRTVFLMTYIAPGPVADQYLAMVNQSIETFL
jgi:hypothetical protein